MKTCPACEQGPLSEEELQEATDKMNNDPCPSCAALRAEVARLGETVQWALGFSTNDDNTVTYRVTNHDDRKELRRRAALKGEVTRWTKINY